LDLGEGDRRVEFALTSAFVALRSSGADTVDRSFVAKGLSI